MHRDCAALQRVRPPLRITQQCQLLRFGGACVSMGKQKQGKKKDKQQVSKGDKADNGHELEPVVRLIALHGKLVAVAVGTSFRVLDWR